MNSLLQNCFLVNRTHESWHDIFYCCWYFWSHPPSKHIPKLPFEMAPIDTPSVPRTMTKLNLSPPIVPLLVLWLSQIFQMEIVCLLYYNMLQPWNSTVVESTTFQLLRDRGRICSFLELVCITALSEIPYTHNFLKILLSLCWCHTHLCLAIGLLNGIFYIKCKYISFPIR